MADSGLPRPQVSMNFYTSRSNHFAAGTGASLDPDRIPKGQTIDPAKLHHVEGNVEVYRNLNKNGSAGPGSVVYSVRSQKTGRVISHADRVDLKDATGHVGQAGRQKVIETGVKNVHAVVRGQVMHPSEVARSGEPQNPGMYAPLAHLPAAFHDPRDQKPLPKNMQHVVLSGGQFGNNRRTGKYEQKPDMRWRA